MAHHDKCFPCSYLNIFFFFHDFSLCSCYFLRPYYPEVSNRLYIYMEIKQRIHSFQLEIHSKPFVVYPLCAKIGSSLEDVGCS